MNTKLNNLFDMCALIDFNKSNTILSTISGSESPLINKDILEIKCSRKIAKSYIENNNSLMSSIYKNLTKCAIEFIETKYPRHFKESFGYIVANFKLSSHYVENELLYENPEKCYLENLTSMIEFTDVMIVYKNDNDDTICVILEDSIREAIQNDFIHSVSLLYRKILDAKKENTDGDKKLNKDIEDIVSRTFLKI